MAEQVLDGSQLVDLAKHPSGIVPTLQNIVFTVNMDCRLDLKAIALHARNAEYNPKRFASVIMRIREPKTTALIFASGKMCLAFRLLSRSVIRWKAHQPALPTCMLSSKRGYTLSCTTWNTSSASADENSVNSEEAAEEDPSTNPSAYKNGRFLMLSKVDWLGVFFGFSNDEKPWMVPWTWFTVIQVMFLWFCTFWLVGSWIIPVAAHYLGCSKETLTYRGQALYSLITDIAEGTVGLGILHRCLARFHPLPREWFPISWRGQWYMDVLLGCLMFPVVNRLSQINVDLLPFPSPFISSYEQSIMARDPVASILYAVVVSICCPIWEEVIFRGFLLPSLTRYLPMWASILVSAVVFGLAHFNMQRMLPLTFLGLMMGIMFVRSRNLLSSMFLHSLWNGFVFIGLLR